MYLDDALTEAELKEAAREQRALKVKGKNVDPNATLTEIRELAKFLLTEDQFPEDMQIPALELAQKISDLDEWLSKGGFFPRPWLPF